MKKIFILGLGFLFFGITAIARAETLPVVVTQPAYNLTSNSVSLAGEVTSVGDSPVTIAGFDYGATPSYGFSIEQHTYFTEPSSITMHASNPGSNLSFDAHIDCGTSYHYRAFATNSEGTVYGEDMTFSTLPCGSAAYVPIIPLGPDNTPGVETKIATDVTSTSAKINGRLTSMGGADSIWVGFKYYKTDKDHTISIPMETFTSTGNFNADIAIGLACDTTYHFYAEAAHVINQIEGDSVVVDGKTLTFKTLPCPTTTSETKVTVDSKSNTTIDNKVISQSSGPKQELTTSNMKSSEKSETRIIKQSDATVKITFMSKVKLFLGRLKFW